MGRPIPGVVRALVGCRHRHHDEWRHGTDSLQGAYAVNATGKAVQQILRCASDSYRVEIISNVISEGGSLSGSWAEATRGVSGNVSGRASDAEIVANLASAGFTARLDVRTQGDKQSVTIRPQGGTDVTAVSIALRK